MDSKKSKKNKKVRKFIASSSIQKSTKSWRFSIISAGISDLSKLSKSFEAQFHVLAVDDSLIDRKLIERLLKTSSYQVTAVDSGIKALKYLGLLDDEEDTDPFSASANKNNHEVEVNLIITDYCMPEMTGYDLLRKIKGSRWLRDIPVVIMSSENVPSRINSCLEEGAEEFFLKPVQQSDVNKLKPRLLRGKHHDLLENSNIEGINKRKTMEECVSQDRTRPRYNALEL